MSTRNAKNLGTQRPLVYLAAALFTPFDRDRNRLVAAALEQEGYRVFLPQAIEATQTSDGTLDLKAVYSECRRVVGDAQIVVALVDGAEVDTGVAWELGYAAALGVPTLCFRTDFRESEHRGVNIMIEFSATKVIYVNGYRKTSADVLSCIVGEVSAFMTAEE